MKYIHQLKDWPRFTWDSDILAPLLAKVRYKQGRLLGQLEGRGFRIYHLHQEASLATLTEEVVKSSAIEGEKLDAEQVRSSIARHLGMDVGGTPNIARHIDGIVEMMLDATENHEDPLTADRLFGWHAAIFPSSRSGMRNITVGAWRTSESGSMRVVSGSMGREKIHFEAPEADVLSHEMDVFLEWFNTPSEIDPVLKAAIAHFWFVTIHPFEDGNGRMARAIAEMALARADESSERYYSMSSQIESERDDYYESLKQSQRLTMDITRWLQWFLECLGRCIDGAGGTLTAVLRKAKIWERINSAPVNERQRKIITRLLDDFKGNLNSSKYAKIAKCSTDTALRDIRDLLDRKILTKNPSGGRSTSYRLVEPDEAYD